jgi:hypothetical protein
MQGVMAFYAWVSIVFVIVGTVMVIRKAFASGVLWGVGCILLPVVMPVFVVLKWPEAKKGAAILTIGAVLLGANAIISRRQLNRAISQIHITKITVTTSLDDAGLPVNDLKKVSVNDPRVVLHVRMQLPTNMLYRFEGRLFDESGHLMFDKTLPTFARDAAWNVWFYQAFDNTRDTPGHWRFVLSVNDKQLAEQRFDVVTSERLPATDIDHSTTAALHESRHSS